MKKILAAILVVTMLLTLAACGGKKTPGTTTENEVSTDNQVKSVVTQYGSDTEYKVYTATIYCPEGAYFDEDEYAEYLTDGYLNDFSIYDDVREYSTYSTVYWSRDIYKEEDGVTPQGYGIVEQLYFEGKAAPETAAEYPKHDQKVTDLGFKWEGKDVKLIETTYSSADGYDYSDTFIGVEYTHYYWKVKEGTGETEDNLTAPGLFGFAVSGWDLTVDQYAWIAGQLFGVDSGRTWNLETDGAEEGNPVVNVDAAQLLGTWLERDSDWNNTYTFNNDGTGMLISGPEYPFTYTVSGNVLTMTYEDNEKDEFTISVSGNLLTMIDQFENEILLDKQAAEKEEPKKEETDTKEEKEPENPYVKGILGTWVDKESGYEETFTFNADGTGKYSCVDGGLYEDTFKYNFLRSDYVQFFYDSNGAEGGFQIRIEGNTLYVTNDAVVDMPLIRQ